MGFSKSFFAAIAFLLVTTAAIAQETVFVIRHAEQELSGLNPGLRPEGRVRAKNWAKVLDPSGLDVVVTSELYRSRATGAIVAETLEVPRVEFGKYDYDAVTTYLRDSHPEGVALIVGHSGTISSLLSAFGYTEYVTVRKVDYGGLFVVTLVDDERPIVTRLNIDLQ